MVWLSEDEPRPQILKTGFRCRKQMFTIFYNSQGPIWVDIIMPQGFTIITKYYTDEELPQILQKCNSAAPAGSRSLSSCTTTMLATQDKAYNDISWGKQHHFVSPSSLFSRPCSMWLLAFSKNQGEDIRTTFSEDSRLGQSYPFRAQDHTHIRVP